MKLNSIYSNLNIRDGDKAFENAIKKRLKNPYDYMYMYSDKKYDYFKNEHTRNYIRFRYK